MVASLSKYTPAKPLKILELKENSSEVNLLLDNIDTIGSNLEESGASHVSIIAVMGNYRTGKSFLLDFMTRYLKVRMENAEKAEEMEKERLRMEKERLRQPQAGHDANGVNNANEVEPSLIGAKTSVPEQPTSPQEETWKFGENENNKDFKLADWIMHGDDKRLSEGSKEDEHGVGFEWKPGMTKCTQGIWLWDRPMVFTNSKGVKVAVLLMDTQGAWDSTMSPEQSATIFGITTLLASKLVYNIQNRVDEAQLNNLDYILTFTQTICSELPSAESTFGELAILVRDWVDYEDGITRNECHAVMEKHLEQHMSVSRVQEQSVGKVERLKASFRNIRAWGLPHPGKVVTKSAYAGELDPIDKDFMFLLDDFMQGFFSEDFPQPSAPLGTEIACSHFVQVVMNFAEAFQDNAGQRATDLRKAFVTIELMSAKEQLFNDFKTRLQRLAPELTVTDPEKLKVEVSKLSEQLKHDYATKLKPWKLKDSEERAHTEEFNKMIDEVAKARISQNDAAVGGAAVKLVASPVVGGIGYFFFAHPFTAVVAGVGGLYFQVKKWTRRLNTELTDARVSEGIWHDATEWFKQRWIDLQAIRVACQRITPESVQHDILQATQQAKVFVTTAAATATVGAATASSA